MKRIKNLLLSLALVSCGVLSTSCNNETGDVTENQDAVSISFSSSEKKMIIGDKTKLILNSSDGEVDVPATWQSLDSNVVIVDQNGRIEAMNVGETYIVATYKNSSTRCKISVSTSYFIPTLEFENFIDETESICKNSRLNLNTFILFNSYKFYDGTITYEVSNPNAGRIENGYFVAGNTNGQETDVLIKATWRNFDLPTLAKKVHVKVTSTGSVALNGGRVSSFNLSTVDNVAGQTFITTADIYSIDCNYDGETKTVKSVSVVDESVEGCVNLSENSGVYTLTAVKEGTANLLVKFDIGNSEEFSATFPITVNVPVYKINEVIDLFSIEDGKYFDTQLEEFVSIGSLFPAGGNTIVSATQDGKTLEINGDKIMGVSSGTDNRELKIVNLKVSNGKMDIDVNVNACKKVITESTYFNNFIFGDSVKTVTGYYILGKDISSFTIDKPSDKNILSFGGTFDGNGHKITVKINHAAAGDEFGLFGNGLSGTVKNVAFVNCEVDSCNAGLIAHHSETNALLQDVYINTFTNNKNNTTRWGCFYSTYGYLKMVNVIINIPQSMEAAQGYGAIGIHKLDSASNNNYVIGPNKLGCKPPTYNTTGENQQEDTHKAWGTCVYSSFNNLRNAGKSFTSFSADYWSLNSGYPVFKGCSY